MKLGSKNNLRDTPAIYNANRFTEVKSAKCWKDPMEALGGVGFTHYAVLNHYFLGAVVQVGYVKNPVSLSKNIFSASNFFMHIFYMFVTHLQSVKKFQRKL